jgi:hypothetical protein
MAHGEDGAGMTWLPIETAPKDGTRVLLLAPRRGIDAYVVVGYWCVLTRTEGWATHEYVDQDRALGWQPLPSTDLSAPSPVVEALDRAWRTRCEDYEPWPDGEGDRSSADMTAEHVYELLRDAAIAAIREGGGR